MDKYYLYRYIRLDKNKPFYIGIGTKTNADIKYGTYNRAFGDKKNNTIWKKIKNKTEYKVEILYESDDYELIKEKEKEFIKMYGRIDLATGCLANMTDGGDGTINVIVSEKARQLRSICHKGKVPWNKNIKGYKKQPHTDDSKRNISLAKSKSVIQFSLSGEFIKEWESIVIASETLFIPRSSICQCANYKNRKVFTAFNFIWIYTEDYVINRIDKLTIALERVKQGKIKKVISTIEKENIINNYIKLYSTFERKKECLQYLSNKFNINYSTIRAIVYNVNI